MLLGHSDVRFHNHRRDTGRQLSVENSRLSKAVGATPLCRLISILSSETLTDDDDVATDGPKYFPIGAPVGTGTSK